jgi:predicted dehydrogenase
VLEHAGYTLCCLIAFFGPVASITTHAERLVPDKPGTGAPQAADFSVGTLHFASGVVVRLTCSIVAPEDRSLQIFGEEGTLSIGDFWEYGAEVCVQGVFSMARFRGWIRAHQAELALSEEDLALVLSALEPPSANEASPEPEMRAKVALTRITRRHLARVQSELSATRTITLVRPAPATGLHSNMDFARGVAECADAATERRAGRLSGAFALHVLECTLALRESGQTKLRTSCESFVPMPWAR